MPTITDFQEYIDSIEEKDIEEINSLYYSIQGFLQMGSYRCCINNNRYFVQSDYSDVTLMLASDEARNAFLKVLDYQFGGGFGWVGGYYEFIRSMRKDD